MPAGVGGGAVDTDADCEEVVVVGIVDDVDVLVELLVVVELVAAVLAGAVLVEAVPAAAIDEDKVDELPHPAIAAAAITDASEAVSRARSTAIGAPARRRD